MLQMAHMSSISRIVRDADDYITLLVAEEQKQTHMYIKIALQVNCD